MFHSRVKPFHIFPTPTGDPEDVLAAYLPHLFPDETASCLGDPGQIVVYASSRYGALQVMVPAYPVARGEGEAGTVEAGRRLFAHYLWGGAMVAADGIEKAVQEEAEQEEGRRRRTMLWRVRGERVLELGAGEYLFLFPLSFLFLAQTCPLTSPRSSRGRVFLSFES